MPLTEYFELIDIGETLESFPPKDKPFKLALVSDASTQQLAKVLKALLYKNGILVNVWEAGYDSFAGEILNPKSELYQFKPSHVLLLFSTQKYRETFLEATPNRKESLPSETASLIKNYCKALSEMGIQVILNTLALPIERQFGNYSLKTKQSLYSSVAQLNQSLVTLAQELPSISLLDCQYLAGTIGSQNFFDEKLWTMAKSFCSTEHLLEVGNEILSLFKNFSGKVTKCIVVDLDNTLWGGVIADEGLLGITLSRTGPGEAYLALQRYLLSQKQRGYYLAVCSKNDLEMAYLPFEKHPEMILRKEDFSVFVANWEPKSENINQIAKKLNIGTSSIVFLDDSSFEREEVRKRLPEVWVPELPEDIADFVSTLEKLNCFETAFLSKEDLNRTNEQTFQKFQDLEKTFSTYDEYLTSLEMAIAVKPFNIEDLPRIAQLTQRSNQFNMRTQRFTNSQCAAFSENKEKYLTLSFSLKDKLCDYGLIGLAIVEWDKSEAKVQELLMSCRVLKRGVEEFMMNELVTRALTKKYNSVLVDFIPTEKNKMAKEYLERAAFEKLESGNEQAAYQLKLESYKMAEHHFKKVTIHD